MSTNDESPSVTPPESVEQEGSFFRDLTGVGANWRSAVLVPVLAVFSALIVAAIIIALTDIDALRLWGHDPGGAFSLTWHNISGAYSSLVVGSVGGLRAISETLVQATPLILAGLSVAVGFRAGLFNIGAQGQLLVGGMFALWVGFTVHAPVYVHLPLALLAGALGGAIWGGIPGLLRARTGAHEVITTIMLNFVALRLVDYYLKSSWFQAVGRDDPVSKSIDVSAQLPRVFGFLDRDDVRVHLGIVVALLAAWFVYWLLFKTTIGYEFRAVGLNPRGALYAGMSVTWLIVGVMAVAGALAGLAGADRVLGVLHRGSPGFAGTLGFDAITLALLGRSHPWGVVASGLLFGALRAGGQLMQVRTDISLDLILVIQALVVVFIAAPALVRAIYRVKTAREAERLTTGWST
ncbi:MAG TPA: ABC transporter permease [Acidimicrobiia bacterium]|nr:ABC transporter permease [Acidimicrobiia bacterium]